MHRHKFLKYSGLALLISLASAFFYLYPRFWGPKADTRPLDQRIHYRWNQDGILPSRDSQALVLIPNGTVVNETILMDSKHTIVQTLSPVLVGQLNSFQIYEIRLPALSDGNYFVRINDEPPSLLKVKPPSVALALDTTLSFFKVQRCGTDTARGHGACHKRAVSLSQASDEVLDLSGGWHDAGDYIRYVLTTSYATSLLLTAAEIVTDSSASHLGLLEEAEWGLKWLDKMWTEEWGLLFQIGDSDDHSHWRLPEEDDKKKKSPRAYISADSAGANLAGRIVASMALRARLKKQDSEYWKKRAVELYEKARKLTAAQSSTHGFYNEKHWRDDMALAALELYDLTRELKYLIEARRWIQNMEPLWYFGYDQMNSLVYYRWAVLDPSAKTKALKNLEKSLKRFEQWSQKNIFSEAVDDLFWGSQIPIQGAAITALLYEKLTGSQRFQEMALRQWDYSFGKNPWGISFLSGVGQRWMKSPHHQIHQIHDFPLIGYWAPGAVSRKNWKKQKIEIKEDPWRYFQTERALVHDDGTDYVTNEPSLTAASTGILFTALMSHFSK